MQSNQPKGIQLIRCKTHSETDQINTIEICTSPQCQSQPIICKKCQTGNNMHKNHKTIALSKFVEMISKPQTNQYLLQLESSLSQFIEQSKIESLQKINTIRKNFETSILDLQKNVKNYFDKVTVSSQNVKEKYRNLVNASFKVGDEKSLIQKAKYYRQFQAAKNIHKAELSTKLSDLKNNITQHNSFISKAINELINQFTLFFEKNSRLFESLQIQPTFINVKWSPRFKHQDYDIKQDRLTRTKTSQTSWCVSCLGSIEMDSNSKKSYRWSFKIVSLNWYLFIGMCEQQYAMSHNFVKWDWSDCQHGHYCISQDATVFSTSKQTKHRNLIRFKFGVGDIIKMQYIPTVSKIAFVKGDNVYEMNTQKNKKYRFCAYLRNAGDIIDLIHV